MEKADRNRFVATVRRLQKNDVTYETRQYSQSSAWEMINLYLSMCLACDGFSVWIKDGLAWPNIHDYQSDRERVRHGAAQDGADQRITVAADRQADGVQTD